MSTSKLDTKKNVKRGEAYKKHHTHWYLDGSLFVQLGGVRYRVHRSRMVRVSDWFRDALESGRSKSKGKQKQEVEYEEDGTPLVRLDGVVGRGDWEVLLGALDEVV